MSVFSASVSDEALVAYYEIRARADRRCAVSKKVEARASDPLRDEIESLTQRLYRERLGDLRDLAVGEVGVGDGDFARYALAQNVRALVLIDISRDRLDALSDELAAPAAAARTRSIVADAKRLDGIADGELDLLAAKEIIEHLNHHALFLKECRRVLRPHGRLYITTPNRNCIDMWLRNILKHLSARTKYQGPALIREVFGHLFEYLTSAEVSVLAEILPAGFREHIHEFSPRELVGALAEHGFRPVRRWGTPPQLLYHELRPAVRQLLPAWDRAERLSYAVGDNLRVIAERM